jgi:hypothetical protein
MQFLQYREVLGDDDNLLLCGNFGSTVFAGDYKARVIGVDAFSDVVDHVRVMICMWACLQTHRVMQSYIELECIAHPDIGVVVVEHLIKTRTPMTMHVSIKYENADLKKQMKGMENSLENYGIE